MELILLERIHNLGNLGDKVTVKPGYGRNYLLPKGKAVRVTKDNLEKFEQMREELEKRAADSLTAAQSRAEKIAELTIEITANSGTEGQLYGSVGPTEISEAVTALGVELEKKEVLMPEGPIRKVGEYELELILHTEVGAQLKVIVKAQEEA